MGSTMVYAEVYNMMMYPEDYMGKTIKMNGQFVIGYETKADGTMDESTLVFACLISDAMACCSQGMEFSLAGEHTYPLYTFITVTGTYETYEENGYTYCRLADAKISE